MKILVDTHTHTNCSTHAFSTLSENIKAAGQRGLEAVCITDHTPALPDSPHLWHFRTLSRLPRVVDGVRIIRGAEMNILDYRGNIDLPEEELSMLDMTVASIHSPCYLSGSVEQHTDTYIGVIKNPYVTIIGHSANPYYRYDIDAVIRAAKEYNKCIEINNSSDAIRPNHIEICREIALCCKKYGTKIVVSSDAHFASEVGVFDNSIRLLDSIDFPEELIMNTTADKFLNYLENRQTMEDF